MKDDERRQHHRFRLWLPARLDGTGQDTNLAIGHDVSQSGALLVTRHELVVGSSLNLRIRLPPDSDQELQLQAMVVRSGANVEDPEGLWPYQAAVEFKDVSPQVEQLLRAHSAMLEGVTEAGEQQR